MNYTTEQFSKLPKWARIEIERLEKNVEYHQKQAEAVKSGNSRVYWGMKILDGGRYGIPENQSVAFTLMDGESIEFKLDDKSDGVRVYLDGKRRRTLAVSPVSSNVMVVSAK